MSNRQNRRPEDGRAGTSAGGVGLVIALATSTAWPQLLPVVGPPVRIDPGGGTAAANETTAAVSEANPQEIIAGWNDWRESDETENVRGGFSLSQDVGQTWTDFLIRPPEQYQSWAEGDPMTAFDPRTGTLWAGAISWGEPDHCLFVARKDPGASEFHPSVAACLGFLDKCWMAAGPKPGMPDTTRLYVAFSEGVIWSDDMGDSFTSPHSLGAGIGFLPRVGPGGELYVAYWDYATGMMLKRSLDGGASFTTHTVATRMDVWGTQDGSRFPGEFRVPPLLYFDVSRTNGTLHACYFDTTNIVNGNRNVDLYFTRSTDQGTTWTEPVIANGDADPPGDQFWCWIECDRDGRLHMVYFDSRHTEQDDNVEHGMFDAYYSYSVNEGETWHEFRLTPDSWDSFYDGIDRPFQFIGDYLGLAVADNRAYPVYLDTSAGDPDIFVNVVEVPVWGDTNGDDLVNTADLLHLLGEWGACQEPDGCDTDINGDGVIDTVDLLILLGQWT
jgi:hypothetical protein